MSLDQQRADLELTHRILNYLQALSHGEVFFLEALKELGSPEITDDALTQARTALQSMLELYQGMGKGVYTFSARWQTPETFEAQRAVRLLEDLLRRNRALAARCRSMPQKFSLEVRELARFAFAVVRRGLVAENFFNQGRFDLARLMGPEARAADAEKIALSSMRQLEAFDREYYDAMRRKELSDQQEQVLNLLWGRQRLMLDVQSVDLVELLSVLRGGEAFIDQELSSPSLQSWHLRGFVTAEASRWIAFEFGIEQASQWKGVGVVSPIDAYGWIGAGFTPEEAQSWLPLNQSAEACLAWKQANFGPDLALSFVKRGLLKPSDVDLAER